ncbi:hypothetical protein GGR56DRAFT_691413 [Xylariaceae sp. FL0804]|nr:hypothetical protein GGR56DRAFT_691413 [Xylariaceae sp. FL0804]
MVLMAEPEAACPRALTATTVVVDPDGDLQLIVGQTRCVPTLTSLANRLDDEDDDDEPTSDYGGDDDKYDDEHAHEAAVVFVVCSRALARASPVWKRMLYGGFAESQRRPASLDSSSSSSFDATTTTTTTTTSGGGGGGHWTVELPEDDAGAMATLLHIVHGRFGQLPRWAGCADARCGGAIPTAALYRLAVLTDRYDLAGALRPWARAWLAAVDARHEALAAALRAPFVTTTRRTRTTTGEEEDEVEEEEEEQRNAGAGAGLSRAKDLPRWLWIAWELGDAPLFEKAAASLVLCATEPDPFSRSRAVLELPELEPPDLNEILATCRQRLLESILDPIRDAIDRLLTNDMSSRYMFLSFGVIAPAGPLCSWAAAADPKDRPSSRAWAAPGGASATQSQSRCHDTMLGTVVRSLARRRLWPLPSTAWLMARRSVVDLAADLQGVETCSRLRGHEACCAIEDLRGKIRDAITGVDVQLPEFYYRHMEAQARKTGLA